MTITEELERLESWLRMNYDLHEEVTSVADALSTLAERYRNHIAVRATTGMASNGGFEASLYVQSEEWCWDSTEKGALDALQDVFDKR
jgi:hypothetical protein